MSGRLVGEVLDNAHRFNLTHAEVRLLCCLAERANDETRMAWPGMDELRKRMDVAEDKAVGRVLRNLAAKGLETREPLRSADDGRVMLDSRGRAMYAVKGHQTTYRIPNMS